MAFTFPLVETKPDQCVLFALALVPSIAAVVILYGRCEPRPNDDFTDLATSSCTIALRYPVAFANVLFFVNIDVIFYIIGILQHNFWLIDPYWTILPPCLAILYQQNPNARSNPVRSAVSMTLIWIWALRLTHSYFRREEWKFGQQEDWRYTKMARENPRLWWIVSFFAVGLAQQPMLIGISLPAYSIHSSDLPWGLVDIGCQCDMRWWTCDRIHSRQPAVQLHAEQQKACSPRRTKGATHEQRALVLLPPP
jgi:hypothetical protein